MSIDNNFPETADIETSTDQYAARFSGGTGEWMLSVQEKITLDLIQPCPNKKVLDIGGGHGQLAIPLCRDGYRVTVLSSAESCRHRIKTIIDDGKCTFEVGNIIELPYADNSFESVICFRLLTHCEVWPQLIKELCRVSADSIIVDYPTSQSLNKIAPMLFKAKKKFEGDTRTWKLFKHAEVINEFKKNGYIVKRKKAQFFMPMVLHRALKSPIISKLMEGICRALGLTHFWGSPMIVKMEKKKD